MVTKILVMGHAGHGKDTVCNIICDLYEMKFQSSSYFVAEKAVRPYLAEQGIIYKTLAKMYLDRGKHRAHWYNAIAEYNTQDAARLGRELFQSYDIYCGLRSLHEFYAMHATRLFDVAFWVDASARVDRELSSSISVHERCANYIIDNNGTIRSLQYEVRAACIAAGVVGRAK